MNGEVDLGETTKHEEERMQALQETSWEQTTSALTAEAEEDAALPDAFAPPVDRTVLARAYTDCSRITGRASRTFFLATRFLPREKRRALRALYAMCRVSDDLVDATDRDLAARTAALDAWERVVLAPRPA